MDKPKNSRKSLDCQFESTPASKLTQRQIDSGRYVIENGLKNLQPLWRFENRSKKDKVIRPFQASFAFEAMLND